MRRSRCQTSVIDSHGTIVTGAPDGRSPTAVTPMATHPSSVPDRPSGGTRCALTRPTDTQACRACPPSRRRLGRCAPSSCPSGPSDTERRPTASQCGLCAPPTLAGIDEHPRVARPRRSILYKLSGDTPIAPQYEPMGAHRDGPIFPGLSGIVGRVLRGSATTATLSDDMARAVFAFTSIVAFASFVW
jgi:hypothetical protein